MIKREPKIAIIIIHYNTPGYLKTCSDAILKQSYKNFEIHFIDNNSPSKEGLELMKKNYGHLPQINIIPNKKNIGYAAAANQGIALAIERKEPADYVVITNPDIIYSPTYFEKIIKRIEKKPKIAGITGKVYKYDFENKKPTKIIDTVGLFAYKNRRIIDDGQGLTDKGQFDKEREVFGISGACPLYRREALEDAKIMGEYMDEDFFMYKEDVDLSWRFLLLGWKNLYFPKAVAFHGRGTGIYERFKTGQVLKNRKNLSKFQKTWSFTNQRLMQLKNDLWINVFKDFLHIFLRELLMPFYVLLREPYLFKSYLNFFKLAPKILKKRRTIMKKLRISAKDMHKYFRNQSDYKM
ncbi:glycosyltransferase [Candidatus Peregrinibacteria bacterium]|nr:glycosyltransferase [Candidatus Peregrinibacteria bacterium]